MYQIFISDRFLCPHQSDRLFQAKLGKTGDLRARLWQECSTFAFTSYDYRQQFR
ncbi:hypothetical protein H6G32_23290 [Cylindrospermum sp. FACHB-282]|nr:hypothetical protein [Cylindrospermum sp. FACHB-282]